MATTRRVTDLPLFLDEVDVARAVLGPGHVSEWKCLAPSLERQGMPRVDPVFGGRYWPALKAWFDHRAGIGERLVPSMPDGEEKWHEVVDRRYRGSKAAAKSKE